jgi:succinate dehydrogenase / fumarate reductase cytochrome b subunit
MLLTSQQSFETLQEIFSSTVVKLLLLLPIWFFLHHLCAGIRYLALDLHVGIALAQARASSKLVLVVGILLTLITGMVIW